jgi:catechol 2,3-dioxygenase-like lactoylglutathione lyase family enzyme
MSRAVFKHVNLVAKDWRSLAAFYADVFGCEVVPPERDLFGPELEAATGIRGARIRGAHLRLPGFDDGGPTLEVFQYDETAPVAVANLYAPGLAHLAFEVEDVAGMRDEVIRHGGSGLGEKAEVAIPGGRRVTFVYVRDPEGNIIELQSWRG